MNGLSIGELNNNLGALTREFTVLRNLHHQLAPMTIVNHVVIRLQIQGKEVTLSNAEAELSAISAAAPYKQEASALLKDIFS